ncbi:MAG: N-acetylmuramoyl-L-alanine amidase [Dysgonamonadaceae bacterium]|jgi:N-acetylmuramoyl-L-alanine amidase|nr:N-acetylmuramoyl-L-alanine amidase [Dysgonamonadaceae bacterium]
MFLFVSISASAQQKDFPRKGEGIYAFLRRHNREGEAYYAEFIKLNKNKLGKNQTLLKDIEYTVPIKLDAALESGAIEESDDTPVVKPAEEKKESDKPQMESKKYCEPLFGKDYQDYKILDNELAGTTFFLSSGHGGADSGALPLIDGHKLPEDEYNYDVMLRLARNLLQHGATVHIIIQDKTNGIRDDKYFRHDKTETCMGKKIPASLKPRLQQRVDAINTLSKKSKSKYQRAIFIHHDSRQPTMKVDAFFYYQEGVNASIKLAGTVQKLFREKYNEHQPGRGYSGGVSNGAPRIPYVMRNTKPVSIFAELANMRNSSDQKRYLNADNRQALANWLAIGLIRDYKNSK